MRYGPFDELENRESLKILPNRRRLKGQPNWDSFKKDHPSELKNSSFNKVVRLWNSYCHQFEVKDLNCLFRITYDPYIEDLLLKRNPILDLMPKNSNNIFNKPVILGLEHGVSFIDNEDDR